MTLRDLLGQRIGLVPLGRNDWDTNTPDAQVFGTLAEGSRITSYREHYEPLPLAYAAAAEIVTRVSGIPFAKFIAERLLWALGLDNTVWSDAWPEGALVAAVPHRKKVVT